MPFLPFSGERTFQHLLSKEVGRSVVVGGLCVGTLSHMPSLVRESGQIRVAALVTLFAFSVINALYGAYQTKIKTGGTQLAAHARCSSFIALNAHMSGAAARCFLEISKHAFGGIPVVTFYEDAPEFTEKSASKASKSLHLSPPSPPPLERPSREYTPHHHFFAYGKNSIWYASKMCFVATLASLDFVANLALAGAFIGFAQYLVPLAPRADATTIWGRLADLLIIALLKALTHRIKRKACVY